MQIIFSLYKLIAKTVCIYHLLHLHLIELLNQIHTMKTIHISKTNIAKGVFMAYTDWSSIHRLVKEPNSDKLFFQNYIGEKSSDKLFENIDEAISNLADNQRLYQVVDGELKEITNKITVSIDSLKKAFATLNRVDKENIVIKG